MFNYPLGFRSSIFGWGISDYQVFGFTFLGSILIFYHEIGFGLGMSVRVPVGFGLVNLDFQNFETMLISPVRVLLVFKSDSVWFLPDLVQNGL